MMDFEALDGSKKGGAAGWCFHNGDNGHAKDGVNCNKNAYLFWIFCRKCRDNGELPLKNDDVSIAKWL